MPTDALGVDSIGRTIAEATRGLEKESGAVSSLVRSGNRFEHWWKFSMFLHFTQSPWNRTPGNHIDDGAGVAVEHGWPISDGRSSFARTFDTKSKRVDLVIRKAPTGYQAHLVELKIVDGSKRSGETDIAAVKQDILALKAVSGWASVASGWSVALTHSFTDLDSLQASLFKAMPEHASSMMRWQISPKDRGVGTIHVLACRVS